MENHHVSDQSKISLKTLVQYYNTAKAKHSNACKVFSDLEEKEGFGPDKSLELIEAETAVSLANTDELQARAIVAAFVPTNGSDLADMVTALICPNKLGTPLTYQERIGFLVAARRIG